MHKSELRALAVSIGKEAWASGVGGFAASADLSMGRRVAWGGIFALGMDLEGIPSARDQESGFMRGVRLQCPQPAVSGCRTSHFRQQSADETECEHRKHQRRGRIAFQQCLQSSLSFLGMEAQPYNCIEKACKTFKAVFRPVDPKYGIRSHTKFLQHSCIRAVFQVPEPYRASVFLGALGGLCWCPRGANVPTGTHIIRQ